MHVKEEIVYENVFKIPMKNSTEFYKIHVINLEISSVSKNIFKSEIKFYIFLAEFI